MPHMIPPYTTYEHMTSWYKHPSLTWVPVRITSSISRIIPKIIGRLSLRTWVPEYWGMYTSRSGTFSQYVQFRLTGHSPALLGSIHKRPSPLLSQGAALQNTRFGGNGIFSLSKKPKNSARALNSGFYDNETSNFVRIWVLTPNP